MPIHYQELSVSNPTAAEACRITDARSIASDLYEHLAKISDRIDGIHRWRAKSDSIQNLFFPWLQENYEVSIESTEGFEDTTVRRNRPDAQILIGGDGAHRALVEVERGGTVTNNHDLKDLWKAHLSPLVQHLFLVVPNSIVAENGRLRSDRAFTRSTARLSSFFANDRTRVDVLSVHIFGYGPDQISHVAD